MQSVSITSGRRVELGIADLPNIPVVVRNEPARDLLQAQQPDQDDIGRDGIAARELGIALLLDASIEPRRVILEEHRPRLERLLRQVEAVFLSDADRDTVHLARQLVQVPRPEVLVVLKASEDAVSVLEREEISAEDVRREEPILAPDVPDILRHRRAGQDHPILDAIAEPVHSFSIAPPYGP